MTRPTIVITIAASGSRVSAVDRLFGAVRAAAILCGGARPILSAVIAPNGEYCYPIRRT